MDDFIEPGVDSLYEKEKEIESRINRMEQFLNSGIN